jgi:hypothetical protein
VPRIDPRRDSGEALRDMSVIDWAGIWASRACEFSAARAGWAVFVAGLQRPRVAARRRRRVCDRFAADSVRRGGKRLEQLAGNDLSAAGRNRRQTQVAHGEQPRRGRASQLARPSLTPTGNLFLRTPTRTLTTGVSLIDSTCLHRRERREVGGRLPGLPYRSHRSCAGGEGS